MTDNVTGDSGRFPVEIAVALDALGEAENRELLGQLYDTRLFETVHDDDDIARLDALKTAGLARKRIAQLTDDGRTHYYEISEYGKRWIEAAYSTLGDVKKTDDKDTDNTVSFVR